MSDAAPREIRLERTYPVPAESAFAPLERLGGARGYYYADWLWRLRAWMDRAVGGPARLAHRRVETLSVGDRFDFWRVERLDPPRLLRLRAEMRLPGRGWLEFRVADAPAGSRVTLRAAFEPSGLAGRVYWYSLFPVHDLIFRGLLRRIAPHMRFRPGDEPPRLPRPSISPRQVESPPPCGASCPAGGDVRRWISLVAQRRVAGASDEAALAAAWDVIVDRNPFPAVTGRICPHPCEAGCNRDEGDGAVAVHLLERYVGDWGIRSGARLPRLDEPGRRESIGVVGAGPAGLSFAYQMARRGYPVTVYDAAERPGGMLRYGIPDYRLPPAVLDAEIARIVELGVELQSGVHIGRDVSLDDVRGRHDVLFLGIGAHDGRRLDVPGEEGHGVWSGVDYLRRVNRGDTVELGRRAVVVGGGDTALDAARAARRSGTTVTIVYRRTRAEMPASAEEIDDAVEEGVSIEELRAPVAVRRDGAGRVVALVVREMVLGAPDASGRAAPVPVPGSESEIATDAVIAAVAQSPDWAGLDAVRPPGGWMRRDGYGRTVSGVWSGGDVTGAGIAGAAIGHGREAAEAVHARLRGLPAPERIHREPIRLDRMKTGHMAARSRVDVRPIPVDARLAEPTAEIHPGLEPGRFFDEAERCRSCGLCAGCGLCWMYCAHDCFVPLDEPMPGEYFALSLDRCRSCGKCVDLCPCGYLAPRSPS